MEILLTPGERREVKDNSTIFTLTERMLQAQHLKTAKAIFEELDRIVQYQSNPEMRSFAILRKETEALKKQFMEV